MRPPSAARSRIAATSFEARLTRRSYGAAAPVRGSTPKLQRRGVRRRVAAGHGDEDDDQHDEERDEDPTEHDAGDRHPVAALTSLFDLRPGDVAEYEREDCGNAVDPAEDAAHQRGDGHAVG